MLKETETEETIVFFVTILSLVAFQLGRGAGSLLPPPLATPMHRGPNDEIMALKLTISAFII